MKYTNHTRELQTNKIAATVRMHHDVHIRVDHCICSVSWRYSKQYRPFQESLAIILRVTRDDSRLAEAVANT